jgi:hypothetical protein
MLRRGIITRGMEEEMLTGDTKTAMGTAGVQRNLQISNEALISTSR